MKAGLFDRLGGANGATLGGEKNSDPALSTALQIVMTLSRECYKETRPGYRRREGLLRSATL